MRQSEEGFTIFEILISSVVVGIMSISMLGALVALNSTMLFARQKLIGTQLATNRLEYLKSLPYDNLAVQGGAIYHPSPLPAEETITLDNINYTVKTSINYVDDAYDGCAAYGTTDEKNELCHNLPEPTGAPTDLNPADYKIANVKVEVNGKKVSELDTNISARVAETDSTTGSLTVLVLGPANDPISGAVVNVTNTTIDPDVILNDNTSTSGRAIFYGLPPDGNQNYKITVSKSGYSTIYTVTHATLTPTYPSQTIIVQQSSSVTLTLSPTHQYGLWGEAVDTSGSPISGMNIYAKGGAKVYTETTNGEYYYDNLNPSDDRPSTDGSGNFVLEDIAAGNYIFCGNTGSSSCSGRYLVASVPYSGANQIGSIAIPTTFSSGFSFDGHTYAQRARLYFSNDSNFPRIFAIENGSASKSAGSHTFTIRGANLPCDNFDPDDCGTDVTVKNSGGNMNAECIGSSSVLTCTIDVSGADTNQSNLTISANGHTLNIPNSGGLMGGINVTP